MAFFKIIVPNYNNGEWLRKSLSSIVSQNFTDYEVVLIDDCSTDNSVDIMNEYKEKYGFHIICPDHKVWNGGARNLGINFPIESEYTLFLDSDDWFDDNNCFQEIYNIIQKDNKPDCVSLSYNCVIGNNVSFQFMDRKSPKDIAETCYVACWTKCIKSNLIQLFPENTLMEDVVQNIKQSDFLETVSVCKKPIINWNRNNRNSCSREENQNLQQGKWQSSMFRYAADLMDLECSHDYAENHRKWRLQIALNNIKDGKYIQ